MQKNRGMVLFIILQFLLLLKDSFAQSFFENFHFGTGFYPYNSFHTYYSYFTSPLQIYAMFGQWFQFILIVVIFIYVGGLFGEKHFKREGDEGTGASMGKLIGFLMGMSLGFMLERIGFTLIDSGYMVGFLLIVLLLYALISRAFSKDKDDKNKKRFFPIVFLILLLLIVLATFIPGLLQIIPFADFLYPLLFLILLVFIVFGLFSFVLHMITGGGGWSEDGTGKDYDRSPFNLFKWGKGPKRLSNPFTWFKNRPQGYKNTGNLIVVVDAMPRQKKNLYFIGQTITFTAIVKMNILRVAKGGDYFCVWNVDGLDVQREHSQVLRHLFSEAYLNGRYVKEIKITVTVSDRLNPGFIGSSYLYLRLIKRENLEGLKTLGKTSTTEKPEEIENSITPTSKKNDDKFFVNIFERKGDKLIPIGVFNENSTKLIYKNPKEQILYSSNEYLLIPSVNPQESFDNYNIKWKVFHEGLNTKILDNNLLFTSEVRGKLYGSCIFLSKLEKEGMLIKRPIKRIVKMKFEFSDFYPSNFKDKTSTVTPGKFQGIGDVNYTDFKGTENATPADLSNSGYDKNAKEKKPLFEVYIRVLVNENGRFDDVGNITESSLKIINKNGEVRLKTNRYYYFQPIVVSGKLKEYKIKWAIDKGVDIKESGYQLAISFKKTGNFDGMCVLQREKHKPITLKFSLNVFYEREEEEIRMLDQGISPKELLGTSKPEIKNTGTFGSSVKFLERNIKMSKNSLKDIKLKVALNNEDVKIYLWIFWENLGPKKGVYAVIRTKDPTLPKEILEKVKPGEYGLFACAVKVKMNKDDVDSIRMMPETGVFKLIQDPEFCIAYSSAELIIHETEKPEITNTGTFGKSKKR